MKIDFILCYEHWQRELFALLQLEKILKEKGFKVRLMKVGNVESNQFEYMTISPKVVVFPWVYGNYELQQAYSFYKPPQVVVNMQCEQLLSKRVLASGFFSIKEEATKCFHVSWGEFTTKRYLDAGVAKENILKIGNINLESDLTCFDCLYETRNEIAKKYSLDLTKKWVLYSSNFKLTNLELNKLEEYERRTGNIYGLAGEMIRAKNKTISWLLEVLNNYDEYEIIYRPHPMEKKDVFLQQIQKNNNRFHYISENNINQWIRVVDYNLSWNSTAVIDSITRRVPTAMIVPYDVQEIYKGDLDGLCEKITSYNQLISFLNMEADKVEKQNYSRINNFFYNSEKAIEVLAEELMALYEHNIKMNELEINLIMRNQSFYSCLKNYMRKNRIKKQEIKMIKKENV